ncbi:MAG: DNA mismatch repair endonuclease MutL [Planctomycetota bacterium]|nr:MAG: DNA mismatch repair endonuclease MutL [Planctomycetota bacterium]
MHTDVAARIQQLSPAVVNKIAAGEVIERPASVVKELLENCVDALATRIEVDVEQGGAELIRVVDDGEGIRGDDLELAVASHATSKIADADDLFRVATMGFRGEALASIAEVSRFRLRSRPHDEPQGMELDVEGGIVKAPRPCGCPPGTLVEVRQLFLNTPVRRKFLKTQATEFGHVAEQFTRIALANPRLHLVLRHNGKTVYELPATESLTDRLALFFGSELADAMIPVDSEHHGVRLWGYVAEPSHSKGSRKGQYLYLNGRWIQDRSLQHALGEAYRGLLMVGRYPVAVLFLEVPPELVDVNVHPTKSEVRFQDGQQLYRQLLSTLRSKFLSMEFGAPLDVDRKPASPPAGRSSAVSAEQIARSQQELAVWAREQLSNWQPNTDLSDLEAAAEELERREALADQTPTNAGGPDRFVNEESAPFDAAADDTAERAPADAPGPGSDAPPRPASTAGGLRAMQILDCYLVAESGEGLTVIDQHALHERILYEHLRRRVLAGNVEVQRLLMPVTIELTAKEASLVLDQVEVLAELGLLVEDFGGQTLAITGYPVMLRRADPTELIRAVIEQLESTGRRVDRRDLLDSLLHMMSCKAAIKAGQRLSAEEIESLLAQRHLVDDHHHCPHGRPTALTLSRAELDRQFGRLG